MKPLGAVAVRLEACARERRCRVGAHAGAGVLWVIPGDAAGGRARARGDARREVREAQLRERS